MLHISNASSSILKCVAHASVGDGTESINQHPGRPTLAGTAVVAANIGASRGHLPRRFSTPPVHPAPGAPDRRTRRAGSVPDNPDTPGPCGRTTTVNAATAAGSGATEVRPRAEGQLARRSPAPVGARHRRSPGGCVSGDNQF
jgi:hypothetical protein